MRVDGTWYRTIWCSGKDGDESVLPSVQIIDQRYLPHEFVVEDICNVAEMAVAIKDMHVRGAGLIGCAAAFGMYLAAKLAAEAASSTAAEGGSAAEASFRKVLRESGELLRATRPTAVNLRVGVERVAAAVEAFLTMAGKAQNGSRREVLAGAVAAALAEAKKVTDEDADACRKIGEAGADILEAIFSRKEASKGESDEAPVVNVLTHCNAGWLAFADWGSALSPVYVAMERGLRVHVWVDETRPRNQGAALTAWELGQHGVPHTVIADNSGGHLMQRGLVDVVITGADRVTRGGDACNKIGTFLKAVAARYCSLPFYVALPSSTVDWSMEDGADIPIEQRGEDEVKFAEGRCAEDGKRRKVLLTPEASPAGNWAFDVTPRGLVTGLITERGLADAAKGLSAELARLYPDEVAAAASKKAGA